MRENADAGAATEVRMGASRFSRPVSVSVSVHE